MRATFSTSLLLLSAISAKVLAASGPPYGLNFNTMFSANDLLPRDLVKFDDRPADCPPCFNCNLEQFQCHQFGNCTQASGTCSCPEGFGGDSCLEPLCGSPAQTDRPPRGEQHSCQCEDGWEGIHCGLCKTDDACNALMPNKEGGVCYKGGVVQNRNTQNCDITNQKIVEALAPKKPQATFSCEQATKTCSFQMWIDEIESFYCGLDECKFNVEYSENTNTTRYECEKIQCRCIDKRTLCGEGNGLDIGEFLSKEIKGPGHFRTVITDGGSADDGSFFSEPKMNGLVQQVFGDDSITLSCKSSECLYKTEVPGYTRPVKKINTPLIGGVISGASIFIVGAVLLIVYLRRRAAVRKRGHILLPQEEEDADAKLMADHKPAALHFENVYYSIGQKQILSGIQGAIRPGEITAIMGPSGAGKTSFLDILARKNKKGVVKGHFYINGQAVADDDFRNVIGFVDQEDNMLPTLTVHETILDSAMLRLPKDMAFAVKEQKVEDVEKQLGIWHIKDSLIGSEESGHRGISGGEKRRVAIACELVTSPSLLFLDEPTSGLDAFNAFNVIECLVHLVKTYNRTVIFTIHQPRSNIVALFDNLILLARGRTVYSGPFSQCQAYFDSIGFQCPPGFNIADYLIDLMMHASMPKHPMDDVVEASLGNQTASSSVRAVKSINSKSDVDTERASLEQDELGRPRRISIRQSQERNLFTRRMPSIEGNGSGVELTSPKNASEVSKNWLRLCKEAGVSPDGLDDPHGLPPDAKGTGTDLDTLINSYYGSDVATSIQEDIRNAVSAADSDSGVGEFGANGKVVSSVRGYEKTGIIGQFQVLSVRTWRNLYRNPMLMLTHYAISIVLAVFLGFLFFGLTEDIPGFQNRLGLLFFVLALFGFSTLTSLTTFAQERVLFVRERAKGYYQPVSYFAAKVIFDMIPLRLIPPLILSMIVYPMAGLTASMDHFWKFVAFLCLFNFASSAVCLFIGIVFRNGGVANLIGSLFMLFSLLFSGFLLNHESIPKMVLWLQMLSIFHFGFEGLIVNEVRYLSLIERKFGLDIEVPGSVILSSFGFDVTALGKDMGGLITFTLAFILFGYIAMHFLLVEQR